MDNWKSCGILFSDFTEELTQQWIDKGFNKEECKEWLDIGMKSSDSDFCVWLRDKKKLTTKQVSQDSEQLRRDYINNRDNPYLTNLQIIQDIKNNPQNWRIDEVIVEYDEAGKIAKKELALIHKSVQIGYEGEIFGSIGCPEDMFSWNPVHLLSQRFNQNEISEINQVFNESKIEVKFTK